MKIGEKYPFPVKINAHIGDGNLHIVLCKCELSDEEWENKVEAFHKEVYTYAYSIGGRLAGEHGTAQKNSEKWKHIPGRRAGDHAHDQGGNGPAADFEPGQDL